MNWIALTNPLQLQQIVEQSNNRPQVIFKHSTRCPISSMAKNRLEKNGTPANTDFYYLDLIAFRSISNKIAEDFGVFHESPQVLLIKKGACIYNESHNGINMKDIEDQVKVGN
jgi:bacillithiol system protein YtxJ